MNHRITIKDVAREAGVHFATVSRALSGRGGVSPELAEKIRQTAERLGYQPDPFMRALSDYRMTKRPPHYRENLAFVWPEQTRDVIVGNPYQQRFIEGARKRAESRGYRVDEMYLRDFTPEVFAKVLIARGIRGVIMANYIGITTTRLRLPVDKFAVVTMTASIKKPVLHRAEHDHFEGIAIALHHLKRRGFLRIGLLLSAKFDRLIRRRYTAGFLVHHPLGEEKAMGFLKVMEGLNVAEVAEWCRQREVEALCFPYSPTFTEEEEKLFEGGPPIFSLDLLPGDIRYSGIYQQMEVVAANAVDLLVEQLQHGELGPPENPKVVYSPGCWVDP